MSVRLMIANELKRQLVKQDVLHALPGWLATMYQKMRIFVTEFDSGYKSTQPKKSRVTLPFCRISDHSGAKYAISRPQSRMSPMLHATEYSRITGIQRAAGRRGRSEIEDRMVVA
jgi:hypothetical protein